MKGLALFVVLVIGYSIANMAKQNVSASTYQSGVEAYMRSPAIELKKVK